MSQFEGSRNKAEAQELLGMGGWPSEKRETEKFAVNATNRYGDEVLKVFEV